MHEYGCTSVIAFQCTVDLFDLLRALRETVVLVEKAPDRSPSCPVAKRKSERGEKSAFPLVCI